MKTSASCDVLRGLVIAHAAVNGGMIANFGRGFAARLVAEGADLHFFASRLPVYGAPPPIKDLEQIGGQFHGLPLPERLAPLQDLWSLAVMALALRRLRVDVLHTRGSIMGGIGRIAAKLAGVRIVIHHQDDLYCRDAGLSRCARRLVAFVEKQLSDVTDCSLFVSEAVLKDALAVGFAKEKCVLVGHDLDDVFRRAANQRDGTKEPVLSRLRRLGVPDGARVVGCVGRLTHHKGIDILVEAAKRLAPAFPRWVFVIKGDGPMRHSLSTAIGEGGLSNRVFLFMDELPREDLPALYRCFDVFALPTRREGFGMVFAEAMAMGVPVVAPRMPPITEVLPEHCGYLVQPQDVDALVRALAQLMMDETLRRRLAEQAKDFALASWCGQNAAERVIAVYSELAGRRRGAAG